MGADDLTGAFRTYLRENGLPVTAQRLAIADIVLGSSNHVSAEDIMVELGARGGAAGTATVYRTLELLERSGLVMERDFGEGFKRFEASRDMPHHEHLLCSVCGRVTEFRDANLERLTTRVAEKEGFQPLGHRLVIDGICRRCQRAGRTVPAGRKIPAR